MSRNVRMLRVTAAVVVVAVAIGFWVIQRRSTRTFEAPYPPIAATADPAVIELGRYLVYGPAACAYCHVPREQWKELASGQQLPLSGSHLFRLPFGQFYSANLTSDAETGVGRRSDGELARILRYGVRADGRAAVPLMEYQDISDQDLTAIISFLRTQPAVPNKVPGHTFSMLGKVIFAFAFTPQAPSEPPPRTSPAGVSIERGGYLANRVSACVACHTNRGEDGQLVGPSFAGGQRMDVAADSTKVYVTPNLTPDLKTSVIGVWTEDAFIGRFRQGELVPGTPMPWGAYGRMTDDDLRSVFRYLRSLPPIEHEVGAPIQRRE
jgi:mono/diheme cytochrome c family protein